MEQRGFAALALIRQPRPGDVARTKAESLVRETSRLLALGGETAPAVLVDPRQPRHGGQTIAGAEAIA